MSNQVALVMFLSVIWIVCGLIDYKNGKRDALAYAAWMTFLIGLGCLILKGK